MHTSHTFEVLPTIACPGSASVSFLSTVFLSDPQFLNSPIKSPSSSVMSTPILVMMFPSQYVGFAQDHSEMMQNNISSLKYINSFLANIPNLQNSLPVHDFNSQSSCISNNSTSDEGDELRLGIINERKQRRMISNRESARRSRMRKQKHLDELLSHVVRLRTENHELIDKLNSVTESHDRVVKENARLKEEASDLRRTLTDVQLASTYNGLRDLEEVPCTTAHLRAESSSYSISNPTNLLQ